MFVPAELCRGAPGVFTQSLRNAAFSLAVWMDFPAYHSWLIGFPAVERARAVKTLAGFGFATDYESDGVGFGGGGFRARLTLFMKRPSSPAIISGIASVTASSIA